MSTPELRNSPEYAGRHGLLDARVVRALGHPVRVKALLILNERVASPSEIAKEIDESVGHVSYHIKVLNECECIELVETTPRRGAMEHFYKATARYMLDIGDWQAMPESVRPGLNAGILRTAFEDVSAAFTCGCFSRREEVHLSWTPMVLDQTGWEELTRGLDETLKWVLAIQEASSKRLAEADEAGIPVSVTMIGYETPTDEEKRAAPKRD